MIKIQKINDLNLSNELEINSKYLNDLEDYGTFFIYHFSENMDNLNDDDVISNRCYLGYSQNNNLYSFVHGNTLGKFTGIFSSKKVSTDIVKTSLFQNHTYTIQKYFDDFNKNELFFTNPTSKTIKFTIENKDYKLKSNNTLLIEIKSNLISIKSNCLFLRPTVFSYKGKYNFIELFFWKMSKDNGNLWKGAFCWQMLLTHCCQVLLTQSLKSLNSTKVFIAKTEARRKLRVITIDFVII